MKNRGIRDQLTSYKFRLYPTKTQQARLEHSINTCRKLYNHFVAESRLAYREGYKLGRDELQRIIPELLGDKKGVIYSKVAYMVLWQFYNNLYVLSTKKGKKGRLRFKSQQHYRSINYNQHGFRIINSVTLKLSKIGKVKIKIHRKIAGKIKEIIITKRIDSWYACIIAEREPSGSCSIFRKKIIGIDLGLDHFVYDSDGNYTKTPQFLRKSEKKLKQAQRKLSKKIIHSNNRIKQTLRLGRIHAKIKNQRNDFLHKISHFYVTHYDTIFVEDLQIQNMIQNKHLAKSIADASWNGFLQKTEYKAARAGNLFAKNAPHGTSQECSRCGRLVVKTLADRIHSCVCGLEIDRDHNAALNILKMGMQSLPAGCRKVTPVETIPLPVVSTTRHGQSMNQEAHGISQG
jgi:putative transposase